MNSHLGFRALFFDLRSIHRFWLRLLSCYLLCMGQWMVLSGGCSRAGPDPIEDVPNANVSDNANGAIDDPVDDGDGDDVEPPSRDDPEPPATLDHLTGWWVVETADAAGATRWGTAFVSLTSPDVAAFDIDLDDDSGPTLYAHPDPDGGLFGQWLPAFTIEDLAAPDNWTGELDGDTLAGAMTLDDGVNEVTFHRAARAGHVTNGVWTRTMDGARAIAASDGDTFLLSVLDDAGDWPRDGRFTGDVTLTGLLDGQGRSFDGLFFDGGARLFLLREAGVVPRIVMFERTDEAGPLSGRWVGGDRRWKGEDVVRSTQIVIEYDGRVYVHAVPDLARGGVGLERTALYERDGNTFADDTPGFEWRGKLSVEGLRIGGEWVHHDEWYHSMDRCATPVAPLNGEWSSVSLDWNHHDLSGNILRAYGAAEVRQDGDVLMIRDVYDTGAAYELEALWLGDHFEGQWWNVDDPATRFDWRGEWLADGSYLHGVTDGAEYSFSPFPIVATSDAEQAADGVTLVADPYSDLLLTIRDGENGVAMTMYQNQERVTHVQMITASGPLDVEVDERLRPTRMEGIDEIMLFDWSDDATSVEVTARSSDGDTITQAIAMDFSDANLLAMLDFFESDVNRDVEPLREWIADNPGYIHAIVSGAIPPPSRFAAGDEGLNQRQRVAVYLGTAGTLIIALTAFVWAFEALGLASIGLPTLLALTGIAIGAYMAAFIVILVVAYYVHLVLVTCFPCTLDCFFNCEPRVEVGACCFSVGCRMMTEEGCARSMGSYLGHGTACERSPCD